MPHLLPIAATAAAAAAPAAAAATASAGLTATLVSVASQAAVSMAINAAMSILSPQVGAAGRPVDWTLDPDGPIPFAFGRVGVAGKVIHKRTFGPDKMYYGFVSVLSGAGPIAGFDSFTADDFSVSFNAQGKAVTSEWRDEMWRATRLGTQPDTYIPTPSGLKNNSILPNWSASHRASGKALSMLVMGENSKRSAYPNGEVKPLEVIRGLLCWDPRLDSTYPGGMGACRLDNPATWVWSENPIICALKWSLGLWESATGKGTPHVGQQVGGIGSKLSGIDVPAFVAAANVCDANGWTCAAYPNTDDDKHQVLVSFFQAAGAIYSQRAGKISLIQRAAARTSVATITADDVIGAIEVDTAASRIDRVNTIQPSYWSPQHRWQITALPEVTAQAYRDQDGQKRSRGVTYPFVSKAVQAAQLAALDIANARESMAGQVALKPHLQRIQPGDTFTISEPGFLLDGVKCLCMNTEYDPAEAVVRVTFISETDAKYPFALGQSTVVPTPPTLVAPINEVSPPLPEDWVVVVRPPTTGGGQVPGFDLTGIVSNSTATAVLVEWGPSAEGPWTQAYSGPPTVTTIPITGVQPGQTYFIAVSYIRNQNTSTRQVYGPYVAPGLVADDVSVDGPNVLQIIEGVNTGRDAAIAVAAQNMADAQNALRLTLEAADAALALALAQTNAAVGTATAAIAEVSGDLADASTVINARIDGVQDEVDDVWGVVGLDNTTGLRSRIINLENTSTGDSEATAVRVTGLESAVFGDVPGEGAIARITEIEDTLAGTGFATASSVTQLEADVEAADTVLSGRISTVETATADLEAGKASVDSVTQLSAKVDKRVRTFAQAAAPTGSPDGIALAEGDLWIDTDANNRLHRRTGGAWVAIQATSTKVYAQDAAPTAGMLAGDLWFDTNDLNKMYRYSGTAWVAADDQRIAALSATVGTHTTAISDLETGKATTSSVTTLESKVNLKNRVISQNAAPTSPHAGQPLIVGDLWVDTDDSGSIWRWTGTAWAATDQRGANALAELVAARGTSPTLGARFGNLTTTVSDALAGKASVTEFTSLESEVETARGTSASLNQRLNTVDSTVAGKASASSVTALTTRVTSAEGVNAAQNTRLDTAESEIDGKASASSVTTLTSSVNIRNRNFRQNTAPTNPMGGYPLIAGDVWIDADDNNQIYAWSGSAWVSAHDLRGETATAGVTTLTAKIGTVSGTVADALAGKAAASTVTTLESEVTTARGGQSSLNVRLNAVETNVNGRALATDLSALTTRVTSAEGVNTAQNTRLNTAESNIAGKASASELNTLEAEVLTARGGTASLNTRFNNVQADVNGRATAASVINLEARTASRPNLLINGGFENELVGVTVDGGGSIQTSDWGRWLSLNLNASTTRGVSWAPVPVTAGRNYIVSGDTVLFGSGQAYFDIQFQNSAGTTLLDSAQTVVTGQHDFSNDVNRRQEHATSATAPAGATRAVVRCIFAGLSNISALGVRMVKLELGLLPATAYTAEATVAQTTARVSTVETAVTDGATTTAARFSDLEATNTNAINRNANFAAGVTTGQIPLHWSDWSAGAATARVAGLSSVDAIQWVVPAGAEKGIQQYTNAGTTAPGWHVIEAKVTLNAGTLLGAGVHTNFGDAAGTSVNSDAMGFHNTPDATGAVVGNGVVGRTYTFTKLVNVPQTNLSRLRIYAMGGWSAFGVAVSAKTITFHECKIRQATEVEVEVGVATAGGQTLNARITTAEQSHVAGDAALATRATNLEATVNTGANRNSQLAARISTVETATTDGRFAAASTVNTLSATLSARGGNLLQNTDFQAGVGTEALGWTGGGQVVVQPYLNPAGDAWRPQGENTMGFNVPGSAGYSDIQSARFAVEPGKWYDFNAYVAAHRANAQCYLGWLTAAGDPISYPSTGEFVPGHGGQNLAIYTRTWVKAQAPANAAAAFVIFRKFATNAGGDSWMWVTRPMVAECGAGATGPAPYTPGNSRNLAASITDARAVAVDAQGRANAIFGITSNVNNKITGFQSTNNGAISTFDIVADRFRISDGSNGAITPFQYDAANGRVIAQNMVLRGSLEVQSAAGGQRSVMNNNGVTVFDANNVLRVRLGVW